MYVVKSKMLPYFTSHDGVMIILSAQENNILLLLHVLHLYTTKLNYQIGFTGNLMLLNYVFSKHNEKMLLIKARVQDFCLTLLAVRIISQTLSTCLRHRLRRSLLHRYCFGCKTVDKLPRASQKPREMTHFTIRI